MKTNAVKKAKIKDLTREEWRALRRDSIGGSDASVILGLNPYKSKIELYCDKKGLLPEEEKESEAIHLGNDLEDYVAKRFTEATGKQVRRSGYMWQHPEYEYITANIDREIVGENAFLECKTTSVFNKSDFVNGEVPLTYYAQCVHYMAVTGCERAYLAVLVLGKGFYHYTIERSEKEIESLIKSECEFWENHIKAGVPPIADGSEGSLNALDILHPERRDEEVEAEEASEDVARYIDINRLIKKLEKEKDEVKGRLISTLGDFSKGHASPGDFSYLTQSKVSVNTGRLKAEFPEVYEAVSEEKTYKIFKVKERKQK